MEKNAKKYVIVILEVLMAYKTEIFIYLQSYYRAFMRNKPTETLPAFEIERK